MTYPCKYLKSATVLEESHNYRFHDEQQMQTIEGDTPPREETGVLTYT